MDKQAFLADESSFFIGRMKSSGVLKAGYATRHLAVKISA